MLRIDPRMRRGPWVTAMAMALLVSTTWTAPVMASPSGEQTQHDRPFASAGHTPTAPSQPAARRVTTDTIELTWRPSSAGAIAYIVYRDDILVAQVGATSSPSYIDSNLTPGKRYAYEISAVGSFEKSESKRSERIVVSTKRQPDALRTEAAIGDETAPSSGDGEAAAETTVSGPHSTFRKGDIFVSVGGTIQWRLPDWTLNGTISLGGGYATGIAFDSLGYMWVVDGSLKRILKFDPTGAQVLAIGPGGTGDPRSIAADGLGNIYVGQHQWGGTSGWINRLNLAGQYTAWWDVPAQRHSVDSLDMQADGCTLHYVGYDDSYVNPSDHVYRFDACNAVAAGSVGGWRPAFAPGGVRALPDGGDLVTIIYFNAPSWWPLITRYAADGSSEDWVPAGMSRPHALDLLPLGDRYLVGDYNTGVVFEIDTATGTVLAQWSTGASTVRALTVYRGVVLPNLPPPPGTEDNPPWDDQLGAGDPTNTYTGTYSDGHVDVRIAGRGPAIEFRRAYNSNDTRVTPLGPGWTHSYNIRLVGAGDGTDDLILVGPMGRSDRYTAAGSSYQPPLGVHRTLVRNEDDTFTAVDDLQTTWTFDAIGRLTSIRDRYGNASNMVYNALGQLATISDPAGRGNLTLGYNADGRLTSVRDWLSPQRSVSYAYDAGGRLANYTNRDQKTTTYGYDETSHRLASITDPRGNAVVSTSYDAQGRVLQQKDARGQTTGDVTTFDYVVNADGTRVTTVTAPPTSHEPSFHPTLVDTYDAEGRLVRRDTVPAAGETLTQHFTYDGQGNRTSATDPRGATTNYCYDVDYAGTQIPGGADNLTRLIRPAPAPGQARPVTLFRYDGHRNLIQTVTARGVPSTSTASCATDLSAIDPQYAIDEVYDAAGVALLATTRRFTDLDTGVKTSTTTFEYGDAANPGRITRRLPPRGNQGATPDMSYATTMTYYGPGPSAGMLRDATDPLGNRTSYTYDAVGRLLSVTDQLGNAPGGVAAEHTTSFTYDREDRLLSTTRPPAVAGGAANVTQTRYDAVGNPIFTIDANGQVRGFAYDERNSLFRATESPLAWTDTASPPAVVFTTEYAHDAAGNVTRVTRAKGDGTYERVSDAAYDGRGLVRMETQYPSWPSTSGPLVTATTFDPAGNPSSVIDPRGQTTTFGYDALGRLTTVDYAAPGTPDVGYAYDPNGNRTSMTDGTGTTSYVYDEADRLTSVTSPGPKTIGYRYDLDGNRTKLIYPDGTAVAYVFDRADQLATLQDWAGRSVVYSYYPDGAIRDATNPDGSVARYTFDNDRRLTAVRHALGTTQLSAYTYSLDALGNVTGVVDGLTGSRLTERASVSSAGAQGNAWSSYQSPISADGRYVAFASAASNLVSSDTNASQDVFVRDRQTGTTTRVSLTASGGQANGYSNWPAISPDARYVAFESLATNLVSGDKNRKRDVFRRDLQTGITVMVSVATGGAQPKADSLAPAISADGRYVAFESVASGLVSGDTNGVSDVFVRDVQAGTTFRVSVATGGAQGTAASAAPSISADGRYVAFRSDAANLVTGDTNGVADIFVRDLQAGTTSRVSVAAGGAQGNGTSFSLAISGDGRYVTFDSDASNLVSGDTNGARDVFLRDRQAATTTRVSVALDGAQGNSSSQRPSITADARYVGFASYASNLVAGDANGSADVFVRDVVGGSTTMYSVSTEGGQGTGVIQIPAISGDGRAVAYQSESTNLVPGDTNGTADIFVSTQPAVQASSYAYDRLSRLLTAAGPDGTATYAYDPVGNRISMTAAGTTDYTYDRADRILTAGASSITVDANGNMIARGPDTFGYDQSNRLTSSTVAGSPTTFTYDGDGSRITLQANGGPIQRYVYDPSGSLATLLDDGARKYVYGVGLAYAASPSSIEVYHTDRLGSVRLLTNAAGTITATFRTDPWGVVTATTGTSAQPFGFTGEPRDPTGLTYLRARYYDPTIGRFMTRDTWPGSASDPQSLNRYAYVEGNPTTRTDPSGHCGVDVIVDAGFIIYDVASLVFGPPKDREGNWLALGADIGGAAIPCATGLGMFARAGIRLVITSEDVLAHFWRIAKHVDTRTLEAARLELQGVVVAINPKTGRPFNHVQEIMDAQNGLLDVISDAGRALSDPALSAAQRSQLESVLSQASSMLDWTERYVPR